MNKTRKGFLTASSIISIVSATLTIFVAFILLLAGSFITENFVKEIYKNDQECVYFENADGSYYFIEIDEDGNEVEITMDEIKFVVKLASGLLYGCGVIVLSFSVAKLVLAIKILVSSSKNKYPNKCTIALLTISILNSNILEAVLLIVAMISSDKKNADKQNEEIVVEKIN